jgi:hypothetical protein
MCLCLVAMIALFMTGARADTSLCDRVVDGLSSGFKSGLANAGYMTAALKKADFGLQDETKSKDVGHELTGVAADLAAKNRSDTRFWLLSRKYCLTSGDFSQSCKLAIGKMIRELRDFRRDFAVPVRQLKEIGESLTEGSKAPAQAKAELAKILEAAAGLQKKMDDAKGLPETTKKSCALPAKPN